MRFTTCTEVAEPPAGEVAGTREHAVYLGGPILDSGSEFVTAVAVHVADAAAKSRVELKTAREDVEFATALERAVPPAAIAEEAAHHDGDACSSTSSLPRPRRKSKEAWDSKYEAEWMFGDAAILGAPILHAVARVNPWRWSSKKKLSETLEELEQLSKDTGAKGARRPIRLRIYGQRGYVNEESTTVEAAIVRLRSHSGIWHKTSLLRGGVANSACRGICQYGTKCYRRNTQHDADEAHPADDDYLDCCRELEVQPEFVTMRKLFEWVDVDKCGKIDREGLESVWLEVQRLGEDVGVLDDALWEQLDGDCNGHINFAEFSEFLAQCSVPLPLGLDDLIPACTKLSPSLCCGVLGCPCQHYAPRRRRCRYGEICYQKNFKHREEFCHPGDVDWRANESSRSTTICRCGHKRKLHVSSLTGAETVEYPEYWVSESHGQVEFNTLVPVEFDVVSQFQKLVDATYSDVTTRDRLNHSGSWEVPRSYHMVSARRNENSRLWRKYSIRKAELQKEKCLADANPEAAAELPPYHVYGDVKTTRVWGEVAHADALDTQINEWYLFHGTSFEAAEKICQTDFKFRLAGSATGSLYGKGSYLAESITKADEYASEDSDGCCSVLLCRVLGGRVRYCDQRTPDPERLTADCVEGPFDCILGDRVKVSKTYREFVLFDTENLYPEYILKYKRGEFFKSPSHPGR